MAPEWINDTLKPIFSPFRLVFLFEKMNPNCHLKMTLNLRYCPFSNGPFCQISIKHHLLRGIWITQCSQSCSEQLRAVRREWQHTGNGDPIPSCLCGLIDIGELLTEPDGVIQMTEHTTAWHCGQRK